MRVYRGMFIAMKDTNQPTPIISKPLSRAEIWTTPFSCIINSVPVLLPIPTALAVEERLNILISCLGASLILHSCPCQLIITIIPMYMMHLITLTRSPIVIGNPLWLAHSFSTYLTLYLPPTTFIWNIRKHIRLNVHHGLCTANRLTYLLSANLLWQRSIKRPYHAFGNG